MKKRPDLKGQQFNRLTAVKELDRMHWECVCTCGKTTRVITHDLIDGHTKSCGCLVYEQGVVPMIGKRFGKLLVIKEFGRTKSNGLSYLCQCNCGNFKIVRGHVLRAGDCKSCGCLRKGNSGRPKKPKPQPLEQDQ